MLYTAPSRAGMTEIFRYPPSSCSPSSFPWASAFTRFPKTPLACRGQVSRISHPPQSSLQLCCDPVPQHHTWAEGFPSKTKGLTMNFALTRRHGLPLNRRLWDLMKVSREYSSFSPPLLYINGLLHNRQRIVPFLINAQRHDLDSRGNSIMCAQVHVWEVSACFFNVAF